MADETKKRTVKNLIYVMLADQSYRIFNLLFVAILARYLGEIGFGDYALAISFVGLFGILSDWGFNVLTVRDIARDPSKTNYYLTNMGILKIIFSVLTFIVTFIFCQLSGYPTQICILIYALAIVSIFTSLENFLGNFLCARELFKYDALVDTIGGASRFAFGVLAIYLGLDLIGIALFLIIAVIFKTLFSFWMNVVVLGWPKFELDIPGMRTLFIACVPFGLTITFAAIYTEFPSVYLSHLASYEQIGWFRAGNRIVDVTMLFPALFNAVLFPVLSRLHGTSNVKFKYAYTQSIKYLTIFSIPIVISTLILADTINLVLFGPGYEEAVIITRILICTIPFTFITAVIASALQSSLHQKIPMYISLFSAIITVILCFIFLPTYLYIGIAIVIFIVQLTRFAIYAYFARKYLSGMRVKKYLPKIMIASMIASICALILMGVLPMSPLMLLVVAITSFAIYICILYLLRLLKKEEFILIFSVLDIRGDK